MNNKSKILNLVKQADPINPLEYVRDAIKDYAIEKLNSYILQNNDELDGPKSITRGNPHADIMIIGESVSEPQLELGKDIVCPMEGTRGLEMLETVLNHFNVNPDEVFYMNTVNIFPYKEIDGKKLPRTPSKKEVDEHKIFLNYAIDVIRPSLIILLGSVALNVFKKDAISRARGEWIDVRGIPAMPTYHPEYFVQIEGKKHPDIIEELKIDFVDDIQKALLYLQSNFPDNNVLLSKIEED